MGFASRNAAVAVVCWSTVSCVWHACLQVQGTSPEYIYQAVLATDAMGWFFLARSSAIGGKIASEGAVVIAYNNQQQGGSGLVG